MSVGKYNLSLLIMMIILSACGQQKASRTLNVTSSFEVTSSTSGGVLNITGYGPNGKWFSVNATKGTPVSVSIEDGSWSLYAVEWVNGLKSDTLCAASTVNLTSSQTDIYLDVTKAGCQSAAFAGSHSTSSVANSTNGFLPLSIYSCGTFFEHNKSTNTKTVLGASTSLSVLQASCAAHVPADMRKTARAVEIIIPGKLTVGGPTSNDISSGCVPLLGSPVANTGLRIPTNHIPVIVKLHESPACDEMAIPYELNRGLISGSSDHQGVFNVGNTTTSVMLLPYTMSRFSISPFYNPTQNLMPEISCGTSACVPTPPVTAGIDYVIANYIGGYSDPITLVRNTGLTCDDIVINNENGISVSSCEDNGWEGTLSVSVYENSANYCNSNTCSFDLTINGSTVTKYVKSYDGGKVQILRDLYQLLGGTPTSASIRNSFQNLSETGGSVGIVRNIREILMPDGPLGMFGDTLCANLSAEKALSFKEDGQQFDAKVIVKDGSSISIPVQIRSDGLTTFQKQVIFRESINGSPYITREVVSFRCDKKIGMSEGYWGEEPGDNRSEQFLSFWNTEYPQSSVVENYRNEIEFDEIDPTIVLSHRTRYEFLRKSAATKFDSLTMNYELYNYGGTNINEQAHLRKLTSATGGILNSEENFFMDRTSSQNYSLFNVHDPVDMKRTRQDLLGLVDPDTSIPGRYDHDEVTISGSLRRVYLWRNSAGVLKLRYFNGTSWLTEQTLNTSPSVSSDGPRQVRVKINPANGNVLVAYLDDLTTSGVTTRSVKTQIFSSTLSSVEAVTNHYSSGVTEDAFEAQYLPNGNIFIAWLSVASSETYLKSLTRITTASPVWQTTPDIITDSLQTEPFLPHTVRSSLLADGRPMISFITLGSPNYYLNAQIYDTGLSSPTTVTVSGLPTITSGMDQRVYRIGNDNFIGLDGINETYIGKITSTSGTPSNTITIINPSNPLGYTQSFAKFGECHDMSTLNSSTPTCTAPDFETTPLTPVRNGAFKEKSIWFLNPATFKNVFTPLSTFKAIQ